MDRDTDFIPSSPAISSASSSDLDTESTGSFFHDRSTSLGTLMGVSFPAPERPARAPSCLEHARAAGGVRGGGRRSEPRERQRRRRRRGGRGGWWRLCRGDSGPTSLGEFLQVERRPGGGVVGEHEVVVGAGPLFEDGRVLPPASERQRHAEAAAGGGSLVRLPVLLTGICSGGEG